MNRGLSSRCRRRSSADIDDLMALYVECLLPDELDQFIGKTIETKELEEYRYAFLRLLEEEEEG